jgi:hypothetical protein
VTQFSGKGAQPVGFRAFPSRRALRALLWTAICVWWLTGKAAAEDGSVDAAGMRLGKAYQLRLQTAPREALTDVEAAHKAWGELTEATCAYRSKPGADRQACIVRMMLTEATRLEADARRDPNAEIDWKASRFGYLGQFAGSYRYEAVLDEPAVASALRSLTGAEAAGQISQNMTVRIPIALIGSDLVLQGNAPHQGLTEAATVWVNMSDGTVRAALLHHAQLVRYARDPEYRYIPDGLRQFLRPRSLTELLATPQDAGPPPGVRWIK